MVVPGAGEHSPVSLRALALVSGVYDLLLGVSMLAAAQPLARLFGAPAPVPIVNAWLNGVFTLTLAGGYFWAASDAEARRGDFWWAWVFARDSERSRSSSTTS